MVCEMKGCIDKKRKSEFVAKTQFLYFCIHTSYFRNDDFFHILQPPKKTLSRFRGFISLEKKIFLLLYLIKFVLFIIYLICDIRISKISENIRLQQFSNFE